MSINWLRHKNRAVVRMPKEAAVIAVILLFGAFLVTVEGGEVSYDGRSLLIDGMRRMLFSGSIHYPRSTPDMWPDLIAKAKLGGLDVIQTYVFWNIHEPIQGQYNFEGNYDLVRFIKEIRDQGLYVSLRIGPFIESEWNYGGLPTWLRYVPGIVFRTDNEPFKLHMERFVTKIVEMMKNEKLYASQGGPIILSQVENEYQNVEQAFHEKGHTYVKWAASMAVSLQTGVPWMMCKQDDAPDPVINTCNGMNCGQTFTGPNSPNKPSLWTENWTSFYQVYGQEPYLRTAEDIAYAVALFIAKKMGALLTIICIMEEQILGGPLLRILSQPITTKLLLMNMPKWAHLKELHAAVKLNAEPLLMGKYTNVSLGNLQEAHVFQTDTGSCVAFLVNADSIHVASVQFRNAVYELPGRSISILSGCSTVAFNTAKDSGAYLEHRVDGLRSVRILNSNNEFDDLSKGRWTYQVGLSGEKSKIFTEEGAKLADWEIAESIPRQPLVWYMTKFNAPSVDSPLALNLASMGKGEVWINGQSIGRYWVSFKTPRGVPSQSLYHIPLSFLKPSGNLLVLFEEMGGDPSQITLETLSITGVCSRVSESHSNPSLTLQCPEGQIISSVQFSSYGTPIGGCEASYTMGSCHSPASMAVVERSCLGRNGCSIPVSTTTFGGDPCPNTSKSLLLSANC
ncbi:hypothetical protein HPP92_006601 [Vanilla planifolia]|uniref:Beta-galactosidase n=1 Tax=Vanilla planifolia TaxID=51239 RepID=A0A835RLA3_VANPL|nr:hypothetical protein HPP92_006863 [Vanilla planifolia]KAG0489738.1 hypothetical protein HPP92_006601 [Vanilla planifolia]